MGDFVNLDFKFDSSLDVDKSEYRIQVAISDHLNGRHRKGNQVIEGTQPFPGMLVTHAYQGRSKEEGFFLKALGVKPGIADLLCWYINPNAGIIRKLIAKYVCRIALYECSFLEVKKHDGIQSSPQKKVMGHCVALGIPYVIVRSVREAHQHFLDRGLKAVHSGVVEPDTRTASQKKQDAFDMFKP